ncbi:MAG: cupin domain-containing protein [Anaerolineales bacterium]
MKTSSYDSVSAQPAHAGTILAMPVLPEGVQAPFGHAWGHLDPGGEMEPHAHPTQEVYFFHAGHGQVVVGDEVADAFPGMVVDIPPNVTHTVRNNSDGELLWFALWWPVAD